MDLDTETLKILSYIAENPDKPLDTLLNDLNLPNDSVLLFLLKHEYIEQPIYLVQNGKTTFWNKYHITPYGKACLEKQIVNKISSRVDWTRWVIDALLIVATAVFSWIASNL